jgi:nucleoside-diphosphate-sugar epimerase
MKAFVTGGTGFIGKKVLEKLIERGVETYALVRSEKSADLIRNMGAVPVLGDICDSQTMRTSVWEKMQGSDVVYHIAARYKLGSRDPQLNEKINVEGTRNVLELAQELEIPKVVYVSSLAVFGDTHGALVDENYRMPEGQPFLTEYDRTKWKAHYEVAQPLIEKGAPITIVMPGVVYGPGDTSLVGQMMRGFYRGLFPILPGPELTLTFAYLDDIAEGIILAGEKGRPGESYILAGPAMRIGDMVKIWADVSGRREPLAALPGKYLKPFAPLMGQIGGILPIPELFSQDSLAILDASYIARADKAQQEFGWGTRDLREGMRQTFDWIAQQDSSPEVQIMRKRRAAAAALLLGVTLFAGWFILNRRES